MDDRRPHIMHQSKRWSIAPADEAAAELAARLKTSPLIAQILINRGLRDAGDCERFLGPTLNALPAPARLANLEKAAARVARAIADRQRIVIYGDYDVDGITAASILWHAIRILGGDVDFYIPHRIEEGYGLNCDAIRQICDGGAKLIITVDCGITAIEPAKIAAERGVDLIITDHHEWKEGGPNSRMEDRGSRIEGLSPSPSSILHPQSSISSPLLPDCFAIIHPRLPGDGPAYPNPHLCGAGVAFKLAWGIGLAVSGQAKVSEAFRAFLIEATALAALGTIADVVPLVGENRALAHFGLSGLRASKLVGIKALIASAALTGQNLDSFHVGFLLAPRLNACGRMGHARLAVEMLTTEDEKKAIEIATYLEQQNRARQAIERQILEQAIKQIDDHRFADDGCCAIVLGAEGWHAGVIGIVASRIVDRYHRPTVMVALNNGHGQGSARSIAGFHLARAMQACGEHLETFGGHEMAAGLKLQTPRFEDFRAAFCAHAKEILRPDQLIAQLPIDCIGEIGQFTPALVSDLERLGPFGHGNRKPLIVCRDLTVSAPARRVGRTGDHLQLHVKQGDRFMKCIAFGLGNLESRLQVGTLVDLAVEPVINEFNGRSSVELQVKDLQFASL
jgi:single-stranded-DNA-specific exonuclease